MVPAPLTACESVCSADNPIPLLWSENQGSSLFTEFEAIEDILFNRLFPFLGAMGGKNYKISQLASFDVWFCPCKNRDLRSFIKVDKFKISN